MRRMISALLAVLMVLSITACGSVAKPEDVVVKYCDALVSFDEETAETCFASERLEGVGFNLLGSDEDQNDLMDQTKEYLIERVNEAKYVVGEAEIDGDTAVVPVSFTYVDATPVFSAAFSEYLVQGMTLIFSGADDAVTDDLLSSIFMDKTNTVSASTDTTVIEFNCVKQDKEWKLEVLSKDAVQKIERICSCNIIDVLDSLEETFDESFSEPFEEELEEYEGSEDVGNEPSAEESTWHDVPAGQPLELATVKITITGQEELTKLTGAYMDPDVAQEGTKFVVVTAEVENITKSPLMFNNDLPLYDAQEREFAPYWDAMLYYDETFMYTDLAPNIKTTGTMVYHVPSDARDCYLLVGKAGTNEVYRLHLK